MTDSSTLFMTDPGRLSGFEQADGIGSRISGRVIL